jgi:hypothetical protein
MYLSMHTNCRGPTMAPLTNNLRMTSKWGERLHSNRESHTMENQKKRPPGIIPNGPFFRSCSVFGKFPLLTESFPMVQYNHRACTMHILFLGRSSGSRVILLPDLPTPCQKTLSRDLQHEAVVEHPLSLMFLHSSCFSM